MWHILPPNVPLYRVSREQDDWNAILQGFGAFYNTGGRYNGIAQPTVYATRDPLVALLEYGFHAAMSVCEALGRGSPLTYPLVSIAKLWCFTLNTPTTLIDLSSPLAQHHFHYPAHAPSNPSFHLYTKTQQIADQVRLWAHPPAPNTRPEGLIAPSIRTAQVGRYHPEQVILFVFPVGVVNETLQARSLLVDQWNVELQFQTTRSPHQPVGPADARIGWLNPRFRLAGNHKAVSPHPNRPHGQPISANQWRRLDIQFASL